MILVIGAPGSGKSAYAENLITEIAAGKQMAYIATMEPFGEEGQARIKRHRKLRADKRFVTFEEPLSMTKVADEILKAGIDTAILECVSNLVGNCNHDLYEAYPSEELLVKKVVNDIKALDKLLNNLVVVTNYFEADASYDGETNRYIKINNAVNDRLRIVAQQIVEKEDGEWVINENN